MVREEGPLPLGKSPLSLQNNEESSLLARKDTAPLSLQKQRMSSLPHPKTIRKLPPISLESRELLYLLEEIPWQVPLPQQLRREAPLPSRERRELGLPLSRHEGASVSLCQGREPLTISSSCSKLGRELPTKNNGFQTSNLDKRSLVLGPPRGLQQEMRSPLRDPLKQEESSPLVILGKRREFLPRELFYLLASLLSLFNQKKTEKSSLLGSMDRAPPALENNV